MTSITRQLTKEEKRTIIIMVIDNPTARGLSGATVYDRLFRETSIVQRQVNNYLRREAEKAGTDPENAYIISIMRGKRMYYHANPKRVPNSITFWNGELMDDPAEEEVHHPEQLEEPIEEKPHYKKVAINPYWLDLTMKLVRGGGTLLDLATILREQSKYARDLAKNDLEEFERKTNRCWYAALFKSRYDEAPPHCVCVCPFCKEEKHDLCRDKYTGCP